MDSQKENNYSAAYFILGAVFFMWGFLTSLNSLLVEQVTLVFELTYTQAILIQFMFFATFLVMSVPAGKLIDRVGFRSGIIIGLGIAGYACTLFGPAATGQSYYLFMTAMFLLATGITILQVAANPYVVILAGEKIASSKLSRKQAFNSLGTMSALLVGNTIFMSMAGLSEDSMMMMSPDEYKTASAMFAQFPYVILAAVLFMMAFALNFSTLPKIHSNDVAPNVSGWENFKYMLQFKQVAAGAFAIFCYVGAEVAIWAKLPTYLMVNSAGTLDRQEAIFYVAIVFLGGMMIGRFIGSYVLKSVNDGKAIVFCAASAAALILVSIFTEGQTAIWSMLLVGLFNSILFPTIFTLGISGLGRSSEEGGSVLITAIVGGAFIPFITYNLMPAYGSAAFLLPVACYLYIIWFGLSGYKYERIADEHVYEASNGK